MKKILVTMVLLILFFETIQAQTHADKLISVLQDSKSKYVFVAAHRGDWRNAPENSIRALKKCIEMGVDIMETDVRLTKDSVLVLMHDTSIDRTTTGKGKLSDYTYDELQKFYLTGGLSRKTYERIPTFEEFMLTAKGKILINVDKSWKYMDKVVEVLKKTGTLRQALIKGEDSYAEVYTKYASLINDVLYIPIIREEQTNLNTFVDDYLNKTHPIAFEVLYSFEKSPMFEQIKKIKQRGTGIWVNTLWGEMCAGHEDERAIDSPDTNWGWVIENGATMIQTDRPTELLEYLKRKRLHTLN
ncbi:glycerophosphodiester phosphodiesterase family protein [Flavobacterium lipolyticum]|uniref:Glycerophosphodiester phosphodiesterase family protein n=1 Tax=Flavobacterium lipolyticum TaxID=2893754 RepID=A0ABS8LYE8_9FLAO|nr:glycerophosphodiester phosphodiesterase family protein [Flavobacterium sp. F-126]MCC9017602.1 glycerophosphodiester phosphodiesterase family protein [Flavobacterium sp. F-126]